MAWMRRTHARIPLTLQEEAVRKLLLEMRLPCEPHHVFELPPGSLQKGFSVDFLVFLGQGVVIECTSCEKKHGAAAAEIRRRAAYMNLRFQLLKATLPKLVCGAFIEAPYEGGEKIAALRPLFSSADFVAASGGELREALGELRSQSGR